MSKLCCLVNWTKECVRCKLKVCKECWRDSRKTLIGCVSIVSKNPGRKFKHHSWNGLKTWDIARLRREYVQRDV